MTLSLTNGTDTLELTASGNIIEWCWVGWALQAIVCDSADAAEAQLAQIAQDYQRKGFRPCA